MAFGHPHDLLVAADGGGAHTGALASVVTLGGFVCLFAWVAWRFGPTLMRFCGLASWWAGWACGSQGGYGYMVFLVILGTFSWPAGTIWYHARRGRWPSLLSQRLFTRTLHTRSTARIGDARDTQSRNGHDEYRPRGTNDADTGVEPAS